MADTTVEERAPGDASGDAAGVRNDPPRQRVLLWVLPTLATLLLLGVGVGRILAEPDPLPIAAPPTTPVPTTLPPPTTEAPIDPWQSVAARARPDIEWLDVFREPPTDVRLVRREAARAAEMRQLLPPYAPQDDPAFPELPRPELPIEGRESTPEGWRFSNPTPFGSPLVFLVTERHDSWVKVLLPVRPNGTEGWIRATDVVLDPPTRYHVRISLGERILRLFEGDRVLIETGIVIGAESSPTPTGRYFISDRVQKYEGSAYGPWILPVNGYSETMNRFADGVPVIALHGTNTPELIGQPRSNGCIRMPNEVITELKDRLPLGTPVDVWA